MQAIRLFLISTGVSFLFSCNSNSPKKENSPGDTLKVQDTSSTVKTENSSSGNTTDFTLDSLKPVLTRELSGWMKSFKNFQPDSLHITQTADFEQIDYAEEQQNTKDFYTLYKASLSYSPDSSQFIDLYSAGISLEKKREKNYRHR